MPGPQPGTTTQAAARPQPELASSPLAGFADVARSEWVKLRTVRSTWWSLVVALVAAIGIAALATAATSANWDNVSPQDKATFDVVGISLAGLFLAQLAIGVLGVLSITSEYSTGSIRSTLAAAPRRPLVLLAKAVDFAVLAFLVGLVCSFVSFLLGSALLSAHVSVGLGDPGVLRAVIGGALYLSVLGLLGMAIGALLRSTPASIATLFGLVFVLPIVANFLPDAWHRAVTKYDPADAGGQILTVQRSADSLSPWAGFAVFCAYTVVVFAIAMVVVERRDA